MTGLLTSCRFSPAGVSLQPDPPLDPYAKPLVVWGQMAAGGLVVLVVDPSGGAEGRSFQIFVSDSEIPEAGSLVGTAWHNDPCTCGDSMEEAGYCVNAEALAISEANMLARLVEYVIAHQAGGPEGRGR